MYRQNPLHSRTHASARALLATLKNGAGNRSFPVTKNFLRKSKIKCCNSFVGMLFLTIELHSLKLQQAQKTLLSDHSNAENLCTHGGSCPATKQLFE